ELGRQLYHEVGCVACHAPREEAERLQWPFWELEPPATAPTGASDGDAVAAVGTHAVAASHAGGSARHRALSPRRGSPLVRGEPGRGRRSRVRVLRGG